MKTELAPCVPPKDKGQIIMIDKRKKYSRRAIDTTVEEIGTKAIQTRDVEINSLYTLLNRGHPHISDLELYREVTKILLSEKLKRSTNQ